MKPSANPDAAERYGDFSLVRYLTAGGMADLWLARSPRYQGDLVLKKIQPRYVEMTRVVKMFIDEGRIAQALDHPNIVRVVDVGHQDGTYFIAMEYIPGRDLLAICRRGVEVGNFLPRHLAVAILAQAARGLVYAHEKADPNGSAMRVVHCDISPGNIVVGWRGTVKLVDFGIARATIMLRAEDHSVAGKYNYMAPEQIRGEAVDARADLFALGIILYELTVGKRLFRGRPEQVMRLVLDEPIAPPRELRPDYPASLESIVMRALERDPARRYQSARQLRTELMAWLAETGLSHDKRHIAEYLRGIFGAKKQRDADEFAGEGGEDEDLILDKALPTVAPGELQVDPEEPPDDHDVLPVRTIYAPPASGDVSPIMDLSTAPLSIDEEKTQPKRQIGDDERTQPKERVEPEPEPLDQPPTVRMRGDDTRKTVLPSLASSPSPFRSKKRGRLRRLLDFFLRR